MLTKPAHFGLYVGVLMLGLTLCMCVCWMRKNLWWVVCHSCAELKDCACRSGRGRSVVQGVLDDDVR